MNPAWIEPDWPSVPHVRALSTTRSGGESQGAWCSLNLGMNCGDDSAAVLRNRAILRAHLPNDPAWLRQVHGTGVRRLAPGAEIDGVEADAAVTDARKQVCAVLTADCLPVLLCNRQGTEVAAAHAGWRGLCAGILEATVGAMQGPPGELQAWLGPAIGPEAYEVGDEVRDAFLQKDPLAEAAFTQRGNRWLLDLYRIARQRLASAGLREVSGGNLCTFSDPRRFFSYRRDGATGRMATLIWLEQDQQR